MKIKNSKNTPNYLYLHGDQGDGMEDHAAAILKLNLSRHSNKDSNKGPNTIRPYLCSSQLLIRMFIKTSKYTIVSTHFLASNEPT